MSFRAKIDSPGLRFRFLNSVGPWVLAAVAATISCAMFSSPALKASAVLTQHPADEKLRDDAAVPVKKPEALPIPEAVATVPADMQAYSELLEHTDFAIDMVPIRGGQFMMGSPTGEPGRNSDEGPQHLVEVGSFWMSKFEITWDQYDTWGEKMDYYRRAAFGTSATPRDQVADAITRPTPPYTDMSFGMGKENNPAICMTQHAARMYCQWLTAKTGRYYRLPTEAEWEYACRAGTTTAYSFGDDIAQLGDYAWYEDNSDGHYHPVGQKKPNPWGLHDMHGNVAEWVLDQYAAETYQLRTGGLAGGKVISNPLIIPMTEYSRSVRGGGWDDPPRMLRSAVREGSELEWKEQDPQLPQSIWYFTDAHGLGFRVVRPLYEPTDEAKLNRWGKSEPLQKDPIEFEQE